MTTRRRTTGQDIVQDAEHVLGKVAQPRVQAALKKGEKGRKKKLLEPAFVKAHRGALAELQHRLGGQKTIAAKKKAASSAEKKARVALAAAMRPVRDAVALTPGVNEQAAIALGRGRPLRVDSTAAILAAAGAMIDAAGGTVGKAALKDAGVAPAAMKHIAKLRDALAAAGTTQSTMLGMGREATSETKKLLSAVRSGTARIRKVVAHVLRDQPALLKQFASTVARYTTKKRARAPKPLTPAHRMTAAAQGGGNGAQTPSGTGVAANGG